MLVKKIFPGDLVKFNFWSSYLAPSVSPDETGNIRWYEIFPGDRGLVVQINQPSHEGDNANNMVTVIFARIEKVLKVHVDQLKIDE
jgi:hypothetical protein